MYLLLKENYRGGKGGIRQRSLRERCYRKQGDRGEGCRCFIGDMVAEEKSFVKGGAAKHLAKQKDSATFAVLWKKRDSCCVDLRRFERGAPQDPVESPNT